MVTGSSDKSVDDSLSDTENRSNKDITTVTTRDNKRIESDRKESECQVL